MQYELMSCHDSVAMYCSLYVKAPPIARDARTELFSTLKLSLCYGYLQCAFIEITESLYSSV